MNQNRKWKKQAMSALAIAASITLCQGNVLAAEGEVFKDESVYVNLDAEGNTKEITVSDWLKYAGKDKELKDTSSLTDIKNVKGEETFRQNGEELVWNTNGEDIYYQGKSTKTLPVTMKVTYKLNGKEITPEKLKGKSGHLEMKLEYKNNVKQEVEINGKKENMYVPFVVLCGGIFPTDTFKNLQVENGKMFSDGEKSMVAGALLPGMKENLGISEDKEMEEKLKIPETVTIQADVKDCKMEPIFTVASSEVFAELGLDKMDTLDELQKSMKDLTDASLKLAQGTNSLAEGVQTLKEKSSEFASGIDGLMEGVKSLDEGAKTLEQGVGQYTGSTGTLAKGIQEYTNGAGTLSSGTEAYIAGVGKIAEGARQQLPLIGQNLGTLSSGLKELDQNLSDPNNGLTASAKKMQTGIGQISAGFSELSKVMTDEGLQEMAGSLRELKVQAVDASNAAVKQSKEGIETAQNAVTAGYTDLNSQVSEKNKELQKFGNQIVEDAQQKVDTATADANKEVQAGKEKVDAILDAAGVDATVKAQVDAALGEIEIDSPKIEGSVEELGQVQMPTVLVDGKEVPVSMVLQTVADGLEPVIGSQGLSQASMALEQAARTLEEQADHMSDAPVEKLSAGIAQLQSGINTFAGESAPLIQGTVSKISENTTMLSKAAQQGCEELLDGFHELQKNDIALKQGARLLEASGHDLVIGSKKLTQSNAALNAGAKALSEGMSTLSENSALLASGTNELLGGISQLSDGANALKEGMDTFQEEGMQKLAKVFGEDFTDLKDRLEEMQRLSREYDSYSGISDGMEGEVKIIMETEEIE